jgi:hypothetical protein
MKRAIQALLALAAALLAAAPLASAQAPALPGPPEECTEDIRRSMAWGVATAAYQVPAPPPGDAACGSSLLAATFMCCRPVRSAAAAAPHPAAAPASPTDRGRLERQPHALRVGRLLPHR